MTKRKILVVDDEEAVRHWVAEFLKSEGYDVLEADGAEAAIAAMPGHRLDGFLLDIDMPGASGTALCRRIRGIKEYETAPIIFVTGSTANQEEAFAAGCDDLIDKPFDPLVLRARLHGHLARTENARMLDGTRRMLDRYVSRRTREVAELEARTGTLSRPERRDVVILFTDIRGFTALSEDIEPGELFPLVSAQLEAQVRLVHEYGGYVDKFGGDGIMAIFEGGGKAAQSCRCALHIMESARRPRLPTRGYGSSGSAFTADRWSSEISARPSTSTTRPSETPSTSPPASAGKPRRCPSSCPRPSGTPLWTIPASGSTPDELLRGWLAGMRVTPRRKASGGYWLRTR